MIAAKPNIAALAPYALADMAVPAGKRPVSLTQNESPLPPSPKAIAAAVESLSAAHLYPDPEWTDLRRAISNVHGIETDRVLCGAGSMELIACLMHCYAGAGDTVLSTQYGYAFFRTAALAAGAGYRAVEEHDLTVSVGALLAAVDANTRIVCVANPGNPTGTRIAAAELRSLRAELDPGILLVIDEAYGEFADDEDTPLFDLADTGNTVILRTFSKAYGLAGMRVGWGVFPGAIGREVRKLLNPNNVSIASQAAASAAMRDQDYMRAACATIADRRERFAARVRQRGLAVPVSRTNFALIRFPSPDEACAADARLRGEGYILRGMGGYGLADCLRATIGREDDMEIVVRILGGNQPGGSQ